MRNTTVSKPEKNVVPEKPGPDEERIAAYLRQHPDFLVRFPDLLQVLALPSRSRGDGIIDMQTFLIERLRTEVRTLEDQQLSIVTVGRNYLASQSQVHAAIAALTEATSLEHLVQIVTIDWVGILDLDVATLCVECDDGGRSYTGVRCLRPGTVDTLIGRNRVCRLREEMAGEAVIFGSATGLVRSSALLRVRVKSDAPICLLALGSRRENRFRGGQGTELLMFMARILEHCLRGWLDRPLGC